jgi:hypothetical protein
VRYPKEVEVASQKKLDEVIAAGDIAVVRKGFYVVESGTVRASGSSTVTAYGSSTVTAYGSSTVRAYGSSTVTAYGSSTVTASGSSTVTAYGSSTVTASGSSTVTASGSSTVTAYGSSTVTASGSSTVRAEQFVAVHNLSKRAKITGDGVVITPPDLTKPKNWLAYHGIPIDNGIAVLFKAVDDNFNSGHHFNYAPGSAPEAPDWNSTRACGNGLHFVAKPWDGFAYLPNATKFVACPVRVSKLVVIDEGKVKAPRVEKPGCVECDQDGNPIKVKEGTT